MDTTFYEDQYNMRGNRDVNHIKRNLTLDFNGSGKRPKLSQVAAASAAPVLSSPDLNLLKLPSPELEQFIIDNARLDTTTPTPTTQILFPKNVTEEQESYVRGFVEALNELHHSGDSSQGNSSQNERAVSNESCSSSGSVKICPPTYTSLDNHYPPISTSTGLGYVMSPPDTSLVKDEPQTVPNSPPMAPIDMVDQERIKLERKRQRNRVAASRCRRRKLERIARLEDKVKELKAENTELTGVVNKLKEQVYNLKEQVMDHANSGCQLLSIMQ